MHAAMEIEGQIHCRADRVAHLLQGAQDGVDLGIAVDDLQLGAGVELDGIQAFVAQLERAVGKIGGARVGPAIFP